MHFNIYDFGSRIERIQKKSEAYHNILSIEHVLLKNTEAVNLSINTKITNILRGLPPHRFKGEILCVTNF
jgi:hypothetical protein